MKERGIKRFYLERLLDALAFGTLRNGKAFSRSLRMVLCDRVGRVYDVWITFGSVHEVRAF